jgi:leucyl/phenylalanyl-tRNA--protein transferase
MKNIAWLKPTDPPEHFPPVEQSLEDPPGLLAVGGDLSTARLLAAYARGIFPWYSAGQPVLWWSPDPRAVLRPNELKISRSLAKTLRTTHLITRTDTAFAATIEACAAPRPNAAGTWITNEMRGAYLELHRQGFAHSIETWEGDDLVGGLYGVQLGAVFFGESMFSRRSDASKIALVRLSAECQQRGIELIDCQLASRHLASMGARSIPRSEFSAFLAHHVRVEADFSWREHHKVG